MKLLVAFTVLTVALCQLGGGSEGLLGGFQKIENPDNSPDLKAADLVARMKREGYLKDATVHSAYRQVVNGFNYRIIYSIRHETHVLLVYCPNTEEKCQVMSWDQVASPTDLRLVEKPGCKETEADTGKCKECEKGFKLLHGTCHKSN